MAKCMIALMIGVIAVATLYPKEVNCGLFEYNEKDNLQIGDFHLIKGKKINPDYILKSDQTVVKNWRSCFKHCFDITSGCKSFNFLKLATGDYMCQPSTAKPHLEAAKVTSGEPDDNIWYFLFKV